ncbi:MAG: galactose-1-phosphate uridylyltransferase [Candidatus Tectomicrobia bacterium]|uniref:Galactose-1-phosphate uridylyltransferase n=1 Tax=Tectimicrobiota bacterium TaxID=2528274 RepID=A0A933GJ00_UNCTE|nr:galactose-1-phosphate uridylyltransferase [Candidatus Tectomicrobia bacterium]
MSILRRDPISGGWVIIAPNRGKRPSDFGSVKDSKKGGFCPFCEGHEKETPPEIKAYRSLGTKPDEKGWQVRTIINKYAVLTPQKEVQRWGEGLYDSMEGFGVHEVIIECPDHKDGIADYDLNHMSLILGMYKQRYLDLGESNKFRYVQIFKNHGVTAGASLEHPHTQIVALPITPRWVKEELYYAKQHYDLKERCLFCDVLRQELVSKERIVCENEHFVAFEPFASKSPFETWVLPKKHQPFFSSISSDAIEYLGEVFLKVFKAMARILDDPPFNYIIHSAPIKYPKAGYWTTIDADFHWHVEILPRLTKMAGFEWGTGFYINPTPPEDSAQYLREGIHELTQVEIFS